MSQCEAVCLVLALLAVPAPVDAQEVLPIPVFVTSTQVPSPPPLRTEAHAAAIEGAKSATFDLAAKLRKEHGDNTKAWPPEVWDRFYVAEDAYQLAIARQDYQAPETRQLLDSSAADFVRDARGSCCRIRRDSSRNNLPAELIFTPRLRRSNNLKPISRSRS